jgi:uncharacterized protein YaiI (UPF0178 family)
MTLFIDGDAFVKLIQPIVTKAIRRYKLKTYLVSNKKISLEPKELVTHIQVEMGIDSADKWILKNISKGDLLITSDIPLASEAVKKGATALDQRGTLYTEENVQNHLAMRNLMQNIRDMGEMTKGPKPYGPKDRAAFANALSAYLQRRP